jgi:hypothetical protein
MSEALTRCKSCGGQFSQEFADRNGGYCAVCWPLKPVERQRIPPAEIEDPIESDPESAWLVELVNEAAEEAAIREINDDRKACGSRPLSVEMIEAGNFPMGFCHRFRSCKKRIFKEYGIDWKSPSELNPGAWYD